MEEILSTDKYDRGSEKYGVRQTFKDFFPDRGCIFFVRPVNEESKLQRIETLDKKTLRPEFLEALEEFKSRISHNLSPKTFGGRELDGNGFLSMVNEILTCFNDRETPQLLGVIERIRGEEKRQRKNAIHDWANRFLHENLGTDRLAERGMEELLQMTLRREGHQLAMEEELFVDGWDYFLSERTAKAEYEQIVRTKLLTRALGEAQREGALAPAEVVQRVLSDAEVGGSRFTLKESYEAVFKKVIDSQKMQSREEMQELQEKLREQNLDLEHEKKKAEMAHQEAQNWKKAIEAGEEESRDLRLRLKNQKQEMSVLRTAQAGDADLIFQLELANNQKTELEKEIARLKEHGSGVPNQPANLEDLLGGLSEGGANEEVRLMVQAMREELMAENENLREKIQELGEQNQNLKMEITDTTEAKDKEIQR